MERRTIGGFIAVLRKANGMTQRELAEQLNVSDKAVSRWERDECAPDLTLIPVLAEIFGVTS
ncbi:MAG: helix-turn-helix transcriptional regulator, partial [Clostridia bacterium]|nr:helix-turn-helix transcriptional regulator [Clostridia bacterium]